MEIQSTFDAQIKKHANANIKLQEQLHKRGQQIHELERKIEEKERELNAIRLDNEDAWPKEDLLREQSKELQSYRKNLFSTGMNAGNERFVETGDELEKEDFNSQGKDDTVQNYITTLQL
ncbi:uncharacterized protein Fot_43238 [Forsythia ovata]|uniref:Uncharacterized protein n=1 Tax=Forsythia ovata TaxID=205694 RepID=A0ABD1RP51_9LAMI